MDKLFGKLNLYDILAMVLPGGVWLLCLITIGDLFHCINARNWTWMRTLTNAAPEVSVGLCIGLLLFVVAYLIGLAQDTIIHFIRDWLRKKKWDVINLAIKKECKENEKNTLLEQLHEKFYDIRAKALEDDKNNNTIYTIEFQCAMIKSLLVPLSLLAALCWETWYWAILCAIMVALALYWLLFKRSKRLIKTIIRHYKI